MKITRRHFRGAPLYVNTDHGTISLVPEVVHWQMDGLRLVRPSTLFVIDSGGVHRLRFKSREALVAVALVAALLGPGQLWLASRRRNRYG